MYSRLQADKLSDQRVQTEDALDILGINVVTLEIRCTGRAEVRGSRVEEILITWFGSADLGHPVVEDGNDVGVGTNGWEEGVDA